MAHRLMEGRKVYRAMRRLWKENMMFREVKRELYEKVVIPRWGIIRGHYVHRRKGKLMMMTV